MEERIGGIGGMKMYKVGDKFIIEIGGEYPENHFQDGENGKAPAILYKIKGFNSLVFDEKGLDRLTNYEDGFIVAFSDAMNKGYEKGLSDAWECLKKIISMDISELNDIFNMCEWSSEDILENIRPREAIKKLKEWEEKQKINVGDLIKSCGGSVAVVQYIDAWDVWHCFGKDGNFTLDHELQRYWEKTGKHIDLTEIFKALEVEDGD